MRCQARQELDRQGLDSTSTGPRQRLDGASTARQLDSQGSNGETRSAVTRVAAHAAAPPAPPRRRGHARDCSSQMHPTGRDCLGPPTLNRFWTCLCQRIDPKRGWRGVGVGRAFIPDHSGLRAPFSADSHPRRRPGPRHSSQTLACGRVSRLTTTRTVSAPSRSAFAPPKRSRPPARVIRRVALTV